MPSTVVMASPPSDETSSASSPPSAPVWAPSSRPAKPDKAAPPTRVRPPDWRERRRQSEQRSRQKRKDTIQSMPEQIAALERAALVVRILPDPDAIWDEFLDDDSKRMRASLRRLLPAIQEVRHLTSTKAHLQRLLREHQLARRALASIVARQRKKEKQVETDPWSLDVERWRELTTRHFRPLTPEQGASLMNAALVEQHRFATSKEKLSTGLSFMGWQDSRRIVKSESVLQFNFEKTYRGHDLNDFMSQAWRLYTEESMFMKNVMGGRGRAWIHVLQELSPTAWVVRLAEKYHGMAGAMHQIFLIFRVESDQGAIQYVTSIPDTDIEKRTTTPGETWTSNSCWSEWTILTPRRDRSDCTFTFSLGGSLLGDDAEILGSYMCELLGALVRAEGVVNYKSALVFS